MFLASYTLSPVVECHQSIAPPFALPPYLGLYPITLDGKCASGNCDPRFGQGACTGPLPLPRGIRTARRLSLALFPSSFLFNRLIA